MGMRIGLTGGAATVDAMVEQAKRAEEDGFHALWYASAVGGDPLVAMALAGRETKTIELGTAVLQTYTCHPVLQANRATAVLNAMGRPGFTLGVGPSHRPAIEDVYGLSYDTPGAHTEQYVTALTKALGDKPIPILVAALGKRLLRVAGEQTAGTVLWMANAKSIDVHVAPRITKAAEAAGRPAPRIVAGLPVAVSDDVDAARQTAAQVFAGYGTLPNYRRILDIGGADGPAEAAIVGDEESVASQINALVDAGATDVWAAIFPVGDDKRASRDRTRALLKDLTGGTR
jgi:alkanesulfonate monooxygenase SsuD/methylene tetrahydromethanopterin reductase-like flavin-dependent oxidoreductase (luciferase family)